MTRQKNISVSVDGNLFIKKYIVDTGKSLDDLRNAPVSLSSNYSVLSEGKAFVTNVTEKKAWFVYSTSVSYHKTITSKYTEFLTPAVQTTDEYFNDLTDIKTFCDAYLSVTENECYNKCKSGEYDIDSILALANDVYAKAKKYQINQTGVSTDAILDYFIGQNTISNIENRVALFHGIEKLIKTQRAIDSLAEASNGFLF